jgi:hypothetical protein
MKRFTLMTTLAAALLGAGLVAAETAGSKPKDEHAGHHPDKAATSGGATTPAPDAQGGMNKDGAGKGGMGNGMMGNGMGGGMADGGMMGMCPGMMGGAAKFEVKKLAKGVTISITSDDAKVVARVQKMAEGMRLMHEANAQ